VEALRDLQAQANQLLGDPGDLGPFDPLLTVADPAPLAAQAARFSKLLRARGLLRKRYDHQLRLCVLSIYPVGAYVVGVVAAGCYFARLEDVYWTGWLGVALASAALASGAFLFGRYAYIETKLTRAEIMAAPPIATTTAGDSS
jgi:hypothetical protein